MSLQAAPTQSAMSQRKRSKLIEEAMADVKEFEEGNNDEDRH